MRAMAFTPGLPCAFHFLISQLLVLMSPLHGEILLAFIELKWIPSKDMLKC
jgi:hypothetical protein